MIRHGNIPGVDLLWTGSDLDVSPLTFVHMTASEMVDLSLWSAGVRMGIVGRSDDQGAEPVVWIESSDEADVFDHIVRGGVWAGEDLIL